VHLVISPELITGVQVRCAVAGTTGKLTVQVAVAPGVARVSGVARHADREVQAEADVAEGAGTAELTFDIPDCPLWSPASPVLWDLSLTAHDASGAAVDAVSLRTGVREVRVHGQQLLLNGQPLILKGFGKHEDSPLHGRGLNLPQLVKDFQLLKWCGANSVRTSHYPYGTEFYDLADEMGVLVIDEVFSINLDFRKITDAGLAAHKQAVSQLIARDGHHPCIIAWSLANEPGYLGEGVYVQRSRPYWQELFAHARALDPTRPLTHANVQYASLNDPAFEVSDFVSINRYYGWYTVPAQLDRAIERLNADFDYIAAAHGKPIFVAEFGADALAGSHATYPQLFTEEFQADFIAAYWAAIIAHPAVVGGHVWNFADFRTAQHGRRVVYNLKGVFTRDRTPKMAAWRVRELWGSP
jgi:beta-glucuronidase